MKLEQLRRHVGDLSQLVSTREVRLSDGPEDGVRVIDVRASGGLSALVLADRGLDLGPVWVAGQQVSWQSSTGIVHPAHFREETWLRSFHGGLLTTCGLQNVGLPSDDGDTRHGLHGRVSNISARNVSHRVVERQGKLVAEVSGEMRETDVFGSDLLLRRRLTLPMGETVVHLHDEVINQGYEDAVVMILYHVNLGYPVVAETSQLVGPPAEIVGRDERARDAVARYAEFPAPADGFNEYVYEHRLHDRSQPAASLSLVNPSNQPSGGIGVTVSWDPRQLPRLWQWRMLGPGMYLTGIEPANCGLAGRAAEREAGAVDVLGPGERREYDLTIAVSLGSDAIAGLLAQDSGEGGTVRA